MTQDISLPDEVFDQFLTEQAPDGLTIKGCLDLSNNVDLTRLPNNLTVTRLTLNNCTHLRSLPSGLSCYELEMQGTAITTLPSDLRVEYRLDLSESTALQVLPDNLKVGSLVLHHCTALTTLPEGLDVYYLDISDCPQLTTWPTRGSLRFGRLNARDCTGLTELPTWMTRLAQLDISGCTHLKTLPDGLRVSSWLDLAHVPIQALPPSLSGVRLRWRDVLVNERIVFHPETLTVHDVLDESNAEIRRVMLERMGYEAFFEQAQAEIVDQDRDPGGDRRLLSMSIPGDETLVCLAVQCPSTERRYVIRVPPTMQTCHQAAAWIAGYDDPADYHPLVET